MDILGIFIAFILSLGLMLLLWALKGSLLKSALRNRGEGLCLVLASGKDGAALEQELNALLWLRKDSLPRARLVLLDEGLSEGGRRLAEIFQLYEPALEVLTLPEAAEELIRRGTDGANE